MTRWSRYKTLIATIRLRDEEIAQLKAENESLREQIKVLTAERFGKRQERFIPKESDDSSSSSTESDSTEDDSTEDGESAPPSEPEASPSKVIKVKGHLRAVSSKKERKGPRIPENLRAIPMVAEVPTPECSCCQKPMAVIGYQETSRTLSVIPEEYFWKVHQVPTFSCKHCPSEIERAKAAKPAERILVDERFLAILAVMKVLYGLPVHRYAQFLSSRGINLKYDTLLGYFIKTSSILELIYNELQRQVFSSPLIHGDESPFLVRIKSNIKNTGAKLTRTYLWPFLATGVGIYYIWAASRDKKTLAAILAKYDGTLCADGLTLYESVAAPLPLKLANCNAHARRTFFRAKDGTYPTEALKALRYYQILYSIERSIKRRQKKAQERETTPPDVLKIRQRFAIPVLNAFRAWLVSCQENTAILPKSQFKKAVNYTLLRWESLTRYTTDPKIPIDNNSIERMIRLFAVGRKNFLFASSEEGAKAVAILFSLIQTCKMHEVDPELYLTDVLVRIHRTKRENIADLLPHRWATLYAEEARQAQAEIARRVQEAPFPDAKKETLTKAA